MLCSGDDPRLTTNDEEGLAAAGHDGPRLSARLTLPRSARLVEGNQLHPKWRSLPSSLRLALAVQPAARRKGWAAEYPEIRERGESIPLHTLLPVLGRSFLCEMCTPKRSAWGR